MILVKKVDNNIARQGKFVFVGSRTDLIFFLGPCLRRFMSMSMDISKNRHKRQTAAPIGQFDLSRYQHKPCFPCAPCFQLIELTELGTRTYSLTQNRIGRDLLFRGINSHAPLIREQPAQFGKGNNNA